MVEPKKYPVSKEKRKEYNDRYRTKNKELVLERNRIWREKNKEYQTEYGKQYRMNNPEKRKEAKKKNYEKNKYQWIENNWARRTASKNASPSWSNKFFIAEIYRLASLRTKITGIKWHVDHIVPIRSDMVCGLHCEHNLQLLEASRNLSKKNFFWPEMP